MARWAAFLLGTILCSVSHEVGYAASSQEMSPRHILFWHLEKAGGNTVLRMFGGELGFRIGVVNEHSVFSETNIRSPDVFRVGIAREPCSYYLSAYEWGNIRVQGWLHSGLIRSPEGKALYFANPKHASKPGFEEEHKRLFRNWVRYINQYREQERSSGPVHPEISCGFQSTRFWSAVLDRTVAADVCEDFCRNQPIDVKCPSNHLNCPCPLADCGRHLNITQHKKCRREVQETEVDFDCWLHTENLTEETKQCLAKYKQEVLGDEATFEQLQAAGRAFRRIERRLQAEVIENQNIHPTCESMYDEETMDLVEALERPYMERFGYANVGCCGRRMKKNTNQTRLF